MRRTGLELSSALAVASFIAAAMVAWYCDLPLRDPDGSTGPTFIRLPAIVLLALLLDIVPRAIIRASTWRSIRESVVEVARERWQLASLRFMLVGLIGWYVTYASIRNLKGMVPFANGELYDTQLDRLDQAMFAGHRPAVLLHDVLGTDIAAHVLSFFYIVWIVALPASLAVALVWARRDRVSSWWVTAVSLDWIMGVILNFALPTLGPIYDRPGDFAGLAETGTTSLQQSMWTERLQVLADPANTHTVQNIAAFASLHVAIATTACIVAHRAGLHRALVQALRVFLVITMIATVYFGWHYVSDVIAGLLVGIVAAWVAERFAAPEEAERDDPAGEASPKRATAQNLAAKPGRS
ncbi:membrane-associated phospholipid phosphatase [Aeromicrobium panaciterrae]|uniref:Membrane-associated phospholipid phosphatase n=1 Tax=Aeromicrobium panaciterrae TaxID=363861 RepID=A0ABU1UPJ5_9ACTN|nr:phosphatase PAP2 family protein [Aeromicrobium panaciterrae]MDR7087079.1 membrane-associated phospholipid phosphatase [Aeromicrobium panaciterrae]